MRRGLIVLVLLAGCGREVGRGIVDNDVTYKVPAIKSAVDHDDTSAIPTLITGLRSEDPAVRLYSIEGLKRLTGESFDYHYYDGPAQRKPAVEKWNAWLAEHQKK